jgi:hypothetical protein
VESYTVNGVAELCDAIMFNCQPPRIRRRARGAVGETRGVHEPLATTRCRASNSDGPCSASRSKGFCARSLAPASGCEDAPATPGNDCFDSGVSGAG